MCYNALLNDNKERINIMKKYANMLMYSDIKPFEVLKHTRKTITIRPMDYERDPNWNPVYVSGGYAGHCVNQNEQKWIITSNENNPVVRAWLHKDGFYYHNGNRFYLSVKPVRYYDYNF